VKGGVLVAVGTLRGIQAFLLSDVEYGIQWDLDQATTAFNRENLDLIAALAKTEWSDSEKRYHYLAILYGKSVDETSLEALLKKDLPESQKLDEFLTSLQARPEIEVSRLPEGTQKSAGMVYERLKKSIGQDPSHKNGLESMRAAIDQFIQFDPRRYGTMPWDSDALWKKVETGVLENRLFAVNASIAGSESIASLARELNRVGEELSFFSVSNALRYVFENEGNTENFLQGLKALPWKKEGLVLLTTGFEASRFPEAPLVRDHWIYFAFDHAEFAKALGGMEKEQTKIYDDFAVFLNRSIQNAPESKRGLVMPVVCPGLLQ
jgi:hypothetical protein